MEVSDQGEWRTCRGDRGERGADAAERHRLRVSSLVTRIRCGGWRYERLIYRETQPKADVLRHGCIFDFRHHGSRSPAFEIYRTRAADAIHTYGGRYLARLGEVQLLEGSWNPNMIVIVEFPNLEQARAWYRSPEYALALEMHDKALSRNLILVDGVNQPAAVK